VDDWVRRCAKPFVGSIPEGRPVFDVDTEAAAREIAAAAKLSTAVRPPLRLADLKQRFGWTRDEQATEAIDRLSCPKGVIQSDSRLNAFGGAEEMGRHQEWRAQDIDAWEECVRRVFPHALPKR